MNPRLRDRKRALWHLREDMYNHALYWMIRERGGWHGGWPPRDVGKVSRWALIQMIADLHGKSAREVAAELIERYQHHEDC